MLSLNNIYNEVRIHQKSVSSRTDYDYFVNAFRFYTVVQKTPPYLYDRSFYEIMLTALDNIWHTVYRVNLQHTCTL